MLKVQDRLRPKWMTVVLYVILYLCGAYCALFLLLMDLRFSTFDNIKWTKEYHAMYRFGPEEQVPHKLVGRTWLVPTTSFANKVFYPLDWLTPRLFPHVAGQNEWFHGVSDNESQQ